MATGARSSSDPSRGSGGALLPTSIRRERMKQALKSDGCPASSIDGSDAHMVADLSVIS